MYAISFDMEIAKLKEYYGEPYNKAYDEIRLVMEKLGFEWKQGSLYILKKEVNNLTHVYKVISKLSAIKWFKEAVRDIMAFKVEDWSDFTDIVKGE